MALSLTLDITDSFNANNGYVADASNWDLIVWQFVAPTGTISITSSNDSGAITGVTDGYALTANSFQTAAALSVATGNTYVTSVTGAGLFRTQHIGQFVKFGGASAAASKVIIQFHKFS